jgi:hypothetical protein
VLIVTKATLSRKHAVCIQSAYASTFETVVSLFLSVSSETTNIILWVCAVVPGKDLSHNAQYQLKRYRPLSLQIGFSLNFIVYITISKGFRDIFRQIMVSIFIRPFITGSIYNSNTNINKQQKSTRSIISYENENLNHRELFKQL